MEPNGNSNIPPVSTGTPGPAPNTLATPTKKSKGLICATIFFALLAIAGIGFGVYFFIESNNKTTENTDLRAKINLLQTGTGTIASSKESSVTVAKAEEVLKEKYGFKNPEIAMYDGWYHYINNFDQAGKILFTIHMAEFNSEQEKEDTLAVTRTISYDDFNSLYVYYFGNTEPLEKKTYELNSKMYINEMVYNPETDSFSVDWPGGIGGQTPIRWFYIVTNTTDTIDGFKSTVASVIAEPGEGYVDSIVLESVTLYEFKFIEEDGDYKLISIEKI